jgi:hypothetical protein
MSRVMSMGVAEAVEVDRKIEPMEPSEQLSGQIAEVRTIRPAGGWDPENFGREQIRALVRQIFFSNASSVRQVVFSPVDVETDVRRICRRVGETLALETAAGVAVAGEYPKVYDAKSLHEPATEKATATLRQTATRMRNNLWLVPFDRGGKEAFSSSSLRSYVNGLQREFEYSIIESAPAGVSNEAAAMAQLADGIVLVISAHHTRRATARNVKEKLDAAQANILGTVLSDRMFPVPEAIYRRL